MPSFNKLQGKRVVIVGGSSGIGRAVAQGCLEAGAQVVILSSNQDKINQAIEKLENDSGVKGKATGQVVDLNKGSLKELGEDMEQLFQKIGKFDHYVHTAGNPPYTCSVAEIDLEKMHGMMRIRHDAAVAAVRAFTKHKLINEGGSITLCSGSVYRSPVPGWTPTVGVTGAVVSLAKSFALELAPIRANAVTPGPVSTEFWGPEAKEMLEKIGKMTLTGSAANPYDTAEAFLYCMRDGSVTGSTIENESGSTMKG